MKKYILRGAIIILLAFLVFWFGSIAFCEVTTMLHGDEFLAAMDEITPIMNVEKLKVVNYSDQTAKVYFYSGSGGALVVYRKTTDGIWAQEGWEKTWSKTGSADDYIWPYIR